MNVSRLQSHSFILAVASVLLAGCNAPRAQLPADAPLIGNPEVVGETSTSKYSLLVPICNRKPHKLQAKVELKDSHVKGLAAYQASGFEAGAESYSWFTLLSNVKQKRTKPIYIKIRWQVGPESGVERFVLAPQSIKAAKVATQ